jgi:thioredoxin 2
MVRTCPSCGAKNRIPAARLMDRAKCGRCKTALEPPREPIEVADAATFDEIVGGATVPVLVDFWAEWCGPCHMVAPEVKKVAEDLAGRAVVLKVDTEALPQVAGRYGIQAIPSFIVFKHGKVAVQQAGAMRAPQLMQLVR